MTSTDTRPDTPRRPRVSLRALVLAGLAVTLLVAGVLSSWASSHPDGLEHVASTLGFADTARPSATDGSPLAGYGTRGVEGAMSGGLAGVLGVLVVGAVMSLLVLLVRRGSRGRR